MSLRMCLDRFLWIRLLRSMIDGYDGLMCIVKLRPNLLSISFNPIG